MRFISRYKSEVGNTADIDKNSWQINLHGATYSGMVNRRQRRALAAGIHIGLAHIMHHIDRTGLGKIICITKLNGLPAKRMYGIGAGIVIHRLAVKADQINTIPKLPA